MSTKNFYQTFYQTEQLFRLDDDPFSAPLPVVQRVADTLLVDTEPIDTELTQTTPGQGSMSVVADLSNIVIPELIVALDLPDEPAMELPVAELPEEPVAELPVAKGPVIEPEPLVEQPVLLEAVPVRITPPAHRPDVPTVARPLLNHKVLILVDEELLPSDLLFLEKILNAINLNINGVDLLNVHGLEGVDFAPILADKVIHHFLTFGVSFQRLNLDILMDRYQPVRFHGITFMIADPLAAIEGDKNLKKRLWEALKRIFLMG